MQPKRLFFSDILFFIILLLVVILSVISYQRINNLNNQSRLVSHSNITKLTIEQTLAGIRDIETSQRDFLLTGDSSFRLLRLAGFNRYLSNLSLLDSLTKSNPLQQLNVNTLSSLMVKRRRELEQEDLLAETGKIENNYLVFESRLTLNAIRKLAGKMQQMEDDLLIARSKEKDNTAFITPLYSLMASVFTIFFIVLTYIVLKTETRMRFNAEDHIRTLSDYFKDLPALFAIVNGPNHIHELANRYYENLAGTNQLNGKTFREVFPGWDGRILHEMLDAAYRTGLPVSRQEMAFGHRQIGTPPTNYYNFIFQPVFNNTRQASGILIFGYEITEMIAARNKIAETEQRSRLAIEAANIGTFDWDLESNRFLSSARLLQIFGFSDGGTEVSHNELITRYHPEDKTARDQAVQNSLSSSWLSYQARIIWPDDTIHWISVYGKTIQDGRGKALRMYGTVIDITEQQLAVQELKESEITFRLLADSMPQFVWMADVNGNLNYFNRAVYDFTGYNTTTMAEQGWISIVHPDEREENIRKWKKAVAGGEEFIFEHRFRNSLGEYRWQLSRALPQKDHYGHIQRWVGTSTDIQAQKNLSGKLEMQLLDGSQELSKLNESLLIKNNIFAQAEENALIGSYAWRIPTGELEYSDNLFRLFGYEPNEFVPSFEKYHSLIHPDDKEQVMRDGLETLKSLQLSANIYRVITKSGEIKHFRSTGKFFGEGENLMLIGTVQDITQDRLLNEILRIKNLQLQNTNEELESFNYIASHDLQEPLRKIQAFSQRIVQKEGNRLTGITQDYFSRINAAAARMQNLINALLSYSRADASSQENNPVNLNELMQQVVSELQETIEEKNATIQFHQLPTIKCIGLQVQQLMINLVSNALKYSKPGISPVISIESRVVMGEQINHTAADPRLQYWNISVSDNGIGFEQEYEHKIFELFQRLHSNNDYMGTGIGLAICKKIIRNHQGFICATGRPGIGAIFNIYFPFS